jgi:hypothetical protein
VPATTAIAAGTVAPAVRADPAEPVGAT